MSQCKWCGNSGKVSKHGYCASCNESVRADIKKHIALLAELAENAAPFLTDEEKAVIHKKMLASYKVLSDYKLKKVPFFKSDIEVLRLNVLTKLGLEPALSPAPPPVRKSNLATFLLLAVVIVVIVGSISVLQDYTGRNSERNLIRAAKAAVMGELKYPLSATFLEGGEEAYPISNSPVVKGAYTVTSYVTADNFLKERVRSRFTVTLIYREDLKNYEILSVIIT